MLKEFEKDNIPISTCTIYKCLDYAKISMIMSKASEYDIRGKRILSRKNKYYWLEQILNIKKSTIWSIFKKY